MTGESVRLGREEYASDKLEDCADGFSRKFNLGGFSGRVSDGNIVAGETTEVAYIINIENDINRLVFINPADLNGVTGEEQAVRRAIHLRVAGLFSSLKI